MPPRVNSKKAAGQERKEEQKVKKVAEEARKQADLESKEWQKGANSRGQARADSEAAKADEAARRRRDKEELLKAEEAELGSGGKASKTPALSKKGKKKKDDLSLLEDELVTSAEKKTRAKKRIELEKQQDEARRRQEKAAAAAETPVDPLMANTEEMIGGEAGRSFNVAMKDEAATGLDAALDTLNVSSGSESKSQKALYKEYEERTMPSVKEDYPGLRLAQYKEKIWAMWKKSPENPMNQVPTSS